MTISEYLPSHLDVNALTAVERPGRLYAVQQERKGFADELLLLRYLKPEDNARELLDADIDELENRFYNPDTPNQWNIRLLWAYEDGAKPDPDLVTEFEESTRFAIRRCIGIGELQDFIAPLRTSKAKLANITNEFDRGAFIENILDQGLGFLFDNLNRDEKFKILRNGVGERSEASSRSSEIRGDPRDAFVDSTQLGEFRRSAHLDKLDAEQFTLLYGRNGTGKTSLLDATALGLIGQIRHDDDRRADDYADLGVTLEGDAEPLPTDSRSVNDRVADWFGFRPHGREPKYSEFYHINYHEAGAATRFIENKPDLDIDQTLRRLLYGEELEDVLKDKRKLGPRLEKHIRNNVRSIEDLGRELRAVREKQAQAVQLFSRLEHAGEKLSPAAARALDVGHHSSPLDSELPSEQNRLEVWTRWQSRFADLQSGCEAVSVADEEIDTADQLWQELRAARDETNQYLPLIQEGKQYQSEASNLRQVLKECSDSVLQSLSSEAGFVGLLLDSYGVSPKELATLKDVLQEEIDTDVEPTGASTVKGWREATNKAVNTVLSDLKEQQEKIEKLDELEERRQELQAEIRGQTESYLEITDDVHYCPACYTEQSREEILEREKPDHLHGDASDRVPDGFMNRISRLEEAKSILTLSEWEEIDYAISVRYDDICNLSAFTELWEAIDSGSLSSEGSFETSEETVETVAQVLDGYIDVETENVLLGEVLERGDDYLESRISEVWFTVPAGPTADSDDLIALERYHENRSSDIDAALHVLEEFWPDDALEQPLALRADTKVIDRTVSKIETTPEALDLPQHFEDEIETIEADIADLQEEIEHCKDSLDRLDTAFEGGDSEAQLKRLVEEHMTVISTLFKAFQRPYEFGEVKYDGDDVVVERRSEREGGSGVAGISEMSSGQRAALALAIFVTNNIAHERAPPLMLLDEPFAHLDDINTLSFFNLLIELARDGSRQIIFATANEEIADLLERKIGKSTDFTRENIPIISERTYPMSNSE
ncbi:chromosome segregation protein SMC [Halorubellus sp. JP-L1]|uniref:AAA family ATPase n=1 Tax=Halorubellus sp. JP-L1 TaxID=2715753 RepID=UPI00140BA59B|nr:AAA family ATPase [Halorubellus sp. JP-L1]NHN41835.1 chromosome segregation protein SMC [Halorubellus sp. JP-L1]